MKGKPMFSFILKLVVPNPKKKKKKKKKQRERERERLGGREGERAIGYGVSSGKGGNNFSA